MAIDWDWTRIVFDHVHIRVQDAATSVAFYRTLLAPLGTPRSGRARTEHSSRTSAAFVLDPDGNYAEAVRREFD